MFCVETSTIFDAFGEGEEVRAASASVVEHDSDSRHHTKKHRIVGVGNVEEEERWQSSEAPIGVGVVFTPKKRLEGECANEKDGFDGRRRSDAAECATKRSSPRRRQW